MMRRMAGEVLRVRETSPDEAETSFRELDDVFLQTQTRIWLGEVLHERFDEEMAVADLLADGELLFQVSKAVWKMILKKNVDIRHSKFFIYERTSFGKADGRYMAYPKVDSFLKICQILGMTGIDLFSPSDVVEKRDIRRVCMCIRSLSKKARLMKLNIPDFDIVTYTIAMPTGLVGGLRRSLELSQRNSSNSNGSSPSMGPRGLHKQKNFSGSFARYHDSFSESDEGESTYSEFEFQSPSSNASSPNMSSIIGESSPEDDNILNKNLVDLDARFQLDYWYQNENDLHWKSFGSNLSGDIDCGYDVNLEIAEKEYEPFGCLSHQAQTIKWNPGDTDVEKSKCSGLPQQSSNDATFYVPETHQRCNNFHKLLNTGFENVSLEEVRERKQNGKPSSSPILTSDYSSNRNTSTDNFVDLMTGKSGRNFSDMENDCIALPDSIVASCRPYLDMKTGDLMLRDMKHKVEEDIIDEAMHCEISSPSSLSACTSKTTNRPSADKDYICETEDYNDIFGNSTIKQSACVIEGETNSLASHGMGITEVSNDLFALGIIKPSAGYHTSTNAAVFTLETDQSHSCVDGDTVESCEHISSSENKEKTLLGVCEYAPAPFGSDSSDATLHANSACIINESCVSVVHKDQYTCVGGGLTEGANGRVAPGIGSDYLEPNETDNLTESCICGNADFKPTCCSEAKLEGTSQGELSEPVVCQDSVIESCHAKIKAHMYCSTLFSAQENEVNAKQNIVDTNQTPPVDYMGDNRRNNLDAAPASKTIEDHEKEVLRMHELNGKNKSRESPKLGNIVLKSVAGGITLVGAAFLFLQFRGRIGKRKANGSLVPPKVQITSQGGSRDKGENDGGDRQDVVSQKGSRDKGENDDGGKQDVPSLAQKPSKPERTNHSGSAQKQAEMRRKKVFYPGDKLKV